MQISEASLGDKEAIGEVGGAEKAPGNGVTLGHSVLRGALGKPHSSDPFFCPLLVDSFGLLSTQKTFWGLPEWPLPAWRADFRKPKPPGILGSPLVGK